MTQTASEHILPGWITTFYIKHRGKRLGPYYARMWKKNGKRYREYVKHADLARVRAACERYRQKRERVVQTNKWTRTTCLNLSFLSRIDRKPKPSSIRQEEFEHVERIAAAGLDVEGRPIQRRRRKRFMGPSDNKQTIESRYLSTPAGRETYCGFDRRIIASKLRALRKNQNPPSMFIWSWHPSWLNLDDIYRDAASLIPERKPETQKSSIARKKVSKSEIHESASDAK